MAATRDQAARAIRPDAESADVAAREAAGPSPSGPSPSAPGEQLRSHVAEETKRIPETPGAPTKPATKSVLGRL